jgi:hypothetical protein
MKTVLLIGHKEVPTVVLYCLTGIFFLVTLSNCSVGMALSGKKSPELGAIRVGSTRGEVELQLGPPIKSVTTEDKRRVDIYEYEVGNDHSAGRAIGHGVLDVFTLGLWEVVGTPVEGFTGNTYSMTITYDASDRVVSINRAVVSLLLICSSNPPPMLQSLTMTRSLFS